MTFYPDEEETRARLERIRAKRGSPERLAQIAAQKAEESRKHRLRAAAASGRKTPENSTEMFGHSWPFWFQMRDTSLEIIGSFARRRSYVTYGQLWDTLIARLGNEVGDSWRQLPILLGHVCDEYHEKVGALPTAIVISQGETHPEAGFFRMAASHGYLNEADAPPAGEVWNQMTENQKAFWKAQVQAVYEHFSN